MTMTEEGLSKSFHAYQLKAFEVDNHKLQAIQLMSEATSLLSSEGDTQVCNDNERATATMEHAITQFKTAQKKAQEAGEMLRVWERENYKYRKKRYDEAGSGNW